jgi:hypothetical protein
MDLNAQKEKFSDAYLQAVVAVAGFGLAKPQPDDDSVDWIIVASSSSGVNRRPRLEVQLKSTSRSVVGPTHVHYPLEIKNYDDLRTENPIVPRILVVVTLPGELDNWVQQSEDELVMKHCAYWMSLRGHPSTQNNATVTVQVPRNRIFTPDTLSRIMRVINGMEAI